MSKRGLADARLPGLVCGHPSPATPNPGAKGARQGSPSPREVMAALGTLVPLGGQGSFEPVPWIWLYDPFAQGEPPRGDSEGHGASSQPPPLGYRIQLSPAATFSLSRCAQREAPSGAESPTGTRGCGRLPVPPAASETWQAPSQHLVSFTASTRAAAPSRWGHESLRGERLGIIIFLCSFFFFPPADLFGGRAAGWQGEEV